MRTRWNRALLCALGLAWATAMAAPVPNRLGYQGRLEKSDGTPESGAVAMEFALFSAPTGGSALWTEARSVAVVDGFYALELGAVTPLQASLFTGGELYLEVRVGSVALTPRQPVGAVAFAQRAASADRLSQPLGTPDIADGSITSAKLSSSLVLGVPTGTVLPFAGATAPQGFLLCEGQAVSRTQYAALFAVIGTGFGPGDGSTTFNLPDLRTRSPIGAGATVALGQAGGAFDHQHTSGSHTHAGPSHTHDISHNHGQTGAADQNHTHNFSDNGAGCAGCTGGDVTAGQSNSHAHAVTAHSGSSGSASGTTGAASLGGPANPPYLGLSFLIKT